MVILYGPPAVGKDTISAALSTADPRFVQVPKVKCGSGRSHGYRFVSDADMATLRANGRLVVEYTRYGNRYGLDRHDLDAALARGQVPVIHCGRVADMRRLTASLPRQWLRVLLWAARDVCARRSTIRGDTDTPARTTNWDDTAAELRSIDLDDTFDLAIRTDEQSADAAAADIVGAFGASRRALPGPSISAMAR